MTRILNALQAGGYIEDEMEYDDTREIFCQYSVCWQDNGEIHYDVFTVYDDCSWKDVLENAVLPFCKGKDVLTVLEEPVRFYINPKTGEEIHEPYTGMYCKDYYEQPLQPYENPFTAVETDELPF